MLTTVEVLKYLPQSIVIEIASLIRTKVYLTNDVIIQSNTHGHELYFIVSGTVAVYTASGKEVLFISFVIIGLIYLSSFFNLFIATYFFHSFYDYQTDYQTEKLFD